MASKRLGSAPWAIGRSGLLVGVFLTGQLQGALLGLAEVPFLDRQRPLGQLGDRLLSGLLVQLPQHRPVAYLAGLGHGHELEAVEPVGVIAEVRLHHLGGLAFGLLRLFEDRGLLAVPLVGNVGGAALGLRRLLAHQAQFLGDALVVDEALDFLGRFLRGLGKPQHLRELLLQSRQLGHRHPPVGGWQVPSTYPRRARGKTAYSQRLSKRRPAAVGWRRPIEAWGARRRSVGLPGLKIWKPPSSSCRGRWLWPKTTASAPGKRARMRARRPWRGPESWTTATVRPPTSTSIDSGSSRRSSASSTFPWTASTTGQSSRSSASTEAAEKSPAWISASAARIRSTHASGSARLPFGMWVSAMTAITSGRFDTYAVLNCPLVSPRRLAEPRSRSRTRPG